MITQRFSEKYRHPREGGSLDNLVVGVSGGRSSALMAKLIFDVRGADEHTIYSFQNTGLELPETLDFVRDIENNWGIPIIWLEYDKAFGYVVVKYSTAARKGEPFSAMLQGKTYLPNLKHRFCTSELKIRPLDRYLKGALGWKNWHNAVGIRYDEKRRWVTLKESGNGQRWTNCFPLFDLQLNQEDVQRFWRENNFDLGIPSYLGNCDLCFLKGKGKLLEMLRRHPGRADWWIEQEESKKATFSKRISAKNLIRLSETPTLFPVALDEPSISCFCGD